MVYSSLFKEWLEGAQEDRKLAYQFLSAGIYRGLVFMHNSPWKNYLRLY